jgi:organic radical activating enzyme
MTDNQKGDEVKIDETSTAYKSVYFEDIKSLENKLNSVSPSFCLAKWFNVSIHIPTGRTHSCYHPLSHHIPLEEVQQDPSALHNTKYKKEQRQKMLNGERPKECEFCWALEDQGNISDRAYRSKDVLEEGIFEEALREGATGNPVPRYVEVNFNQACNFKCAYCSPSLSTEWHKEIKKHGSYKLSDKEHNHPNYVSSLNIDNSPNNPYVQAFWKWFPTVYPKLKTFRMTGGEPLMDKNTFKVFDYVKDNPHKGLHLSITSNCCPPGDQWNKFMSSLKEITDKDAIEHFMLYCSLDSWGPQAEYIRNGLDFNVLHQNVTQYLKDSSKHSLTFIVTANLLSLPNWLEYIKQIHILRNTYNTDRQLIWFDTPMLHDPNWMSMKLASKEMLEPLLQSIQYMEEHKETRDNRYKGFKDFEVDRVKRLYDWACDKMPLPQEELAKKNFHLYFTEHDKRRNTNIKDTFVEITDFIKECEELANE